MRFIRGFVVLLALVVVVPLFAASAGSAAVLGDDYPANLKSRPRDAMIDPWRFYNRECTSFVAWRLNSAVGVEFDDFWLGVHWGNAANWRNAARTTAAKNAGVTVDSKPSVGSVAWWSAGSVGSRVGHVAYVAVVTSSSITIEEYNYARPGMYGTRTIAVGADNWPVGFIHFPPPKISNTKAPSIPGTPTVGVPLKAKHGWWSPASVSKFAYQWMSGGKPITGATAQTYTPTAADLGDALSVKVTASFTGLKNVSATSAASAAVLPGTFTKTAPTISGTAQVGVELTATNGTWTPGGDYAYQWLAGGDPIDGATGTSYTPGPDQLGQKISVRVTATQAGYTTASATSTATPVVAIGKFKNTAVPAITGRVAVGETLTAQPGSWTPAGDYTYQWYAGAKPISGATNSAFTPTPDLIGKTLSVRVTTTSAGYQDATAASAVTAAVVPGTLAVKAKPRITGTRSVGSTLTASTGSWSADPTSYTYQWRRDGKAIPKATTAKLVLTAEDLDSRISVRVAVKRDGYDDAAATSSRTGAIAPGVLTNSVLPTISGHAYVGTKLTATSGKWAPTGVTVRYRWRADGRRIVGATAATFTPTKAELGARLTVEVIAKKAGYTTATATSAKTDRVWRGLAHSATPTVTGRRIAGQRLTAVVSGLSPARSTVSYHWLRDGAVISGATKSTYLLGSADVGHQLQVKVTIRHAEWATGTVTSAKTRTVRAAAKVTPAWKSGRGSVALTLRVSGLTQPTPDGLISVWEGSHRLRRVEIVDGKGRITLKLGKGRHTLRLHFTGTPALMPTDRVIRPRAK